jgi:hypothetical protein
MPITHPIDTVDALLEATGSVKALAPVTAQQPVNAGGWDPYEVWRTRVFAAQSPRYNKDRGNT